MVAVKAHFDGKQIHLPEKLRGAPPGEVVIVFDDRPTPAGGSSVWNLLGAAEKKRSAADIDAQVRAEREAWGDR
jgi:hypothetical protein